MVQQDLANGPDLPNGLVTVGTWLDAFDAESRGLADAPWGERRLQRLHGVQMALDVVAHVHNIPLRLLRLDNLLHLDQTFVRFVTTWEGSVRLLLTEPSADGSRRVPQPLQPAEADALLQAMKQPAHVVVLREWVLRLAAERPLDDSDLAPPVALPPHYAEWFLMLLPHLERDVWLTEMGNPLPVHNLARMVEHWALFILMWAWSQAGRMQAALQPQAGDDGWPTVLPKALDIGHLGLSVLPAYQRSGRQSRPNPVVLLAGPFVLRRIDGAEDADEAGDWFKQPLRRYLERIAQVHGVDGWDEVHEKAPGGTELFDALESKAAIDADEARQRALLSRRALDALLQAELDPSVTRWSDGRPGRPISRANWETMAVLAAWHSRWGHMVTASICAAGDAMHVALEDHRVSMFATRQSAAGADDRLRFCAYVDARAPTAGGAHWRSAAHCIAEARKIYEYRWIEGPATFFARMRERQQAAWTSHISAINHLLTRHSRRDRPEGADDPDARQHMPPACEEADHLLRGFGGRVCRYLLSMARADIAEIYWLDYGVNPPRLRHAGSAERLIQHRAQRQTILSRFDGEIWAAAADDGRARLAPGVELGPDCGYQIYRAATSGHIEPSARERKAAMAQGRMQPLPRFDAFEQTRPQDGVSVPLLFNNRVVGVFALAGVASSRHFDTRLYPSLRMVAQDLGQAMYFHSQVWQMRQINWLASHVPLEAWQRHEESNEFNPLSGVARCLANIFLCPGVHIWLKDRQHARRFLLHGSTAPEVFRVDGLTPEHAPSVTLKPPVNGGAVPLSRPMFAFAIDQWQTDEAAETPPRGQFVQAQFRASVPLTVDYSLRAAAVGNMVLGADSLDAVAEAGASPLGTEALPTLRPAMFTSQLQWTDLMSFALVSDSDGRAKPIGVVSLHSARLRDGGTGLPWPPGWRPVVAHVQTYLPYVLMQTETVARPLDSLRRYLLHEGRNELNAASVQAAELKTLLLRLLAIDEPQGHTRPWLRRMLTQLKANQLPAAIELNRELYQLDQLLSQLSASVDKQLGIEHAENLAVLGRLIERQRGIAGLGKDFLSTGDVHRTEWINLQDSINQAFGAYALDFKQQHIFWSGDKVDRRWQLLTQPRLWSWVLADLAHNTAKYALSDAGAEAALEETPGSKRDSFQLRLSNEAPYHEDVDKHELLVEFGVQGTAGKARQQRALLSSKLSRVGTGIGLWGVELLCTTLGFGFTVDPKPQAQPGRARYHFIVTIPKGHLRR